MGMLERMARGRGAAEITGQIDAALAELRVLIAHHASRVELRDFAPATGVATLVVEGGCSDCDMPAAALLEGIAAHLRLRVPEVRAVRAVEHHRPNNA